MPSTRGRRPGGTKPRFAPIREAAACHVREDKVRHLSAGARARYADLLDRLGQ